jgi:hypothetical protein
VHEAGGFPVADISDHLADDSVVVWLDLLDPGPEDLAVLVEEFQLHPLADEDAVHRHERPTLDRYRDHLFMSAYAAHLELAMRDLVTTILETRLTIQGNRLNEIMKKLTSWAAIIASPPPSPASTARTCPTPASNKSGGSYAASCSSCSSWSSGEPSTWCSNANSGYKNHQGETRPPRSGSPRAERLGCVVALAGVRAGSSNGTASVGAWRATARGARSAATPVTRGPLLRRSHSMTRTC